MYNNGYNPETLVYNYRRIGHGKARADAIRSAVSQADLNNDIPYMIFSVKNCVKNLIGL